MEEKLPIRRLWRYFQWLGRPLLRHGVFVTFMVILMWVTYSIVGEPHTKHLTFYVQQFLLDLYVLCGVLCVMERLGRRHRLWRWAARGLKYGTYVVTYAACFVEAFIYMRFFLAFSPTMLNLVMETNGGESAEFISSCIATPKFAEALRIYGAILAANVVMGLWGYRWFVRLCTAHPLPGRKVRSLLFPTAALTLIALTLPSWMVEKWKMLDYMLITETTEAEKITGNVFYSPVLRLVYSAKFVQVVRMDTERLVARMDAMAAPQLAPQTETQAPTIVLVIGESYNKHHASCYGYPLTTTPYADHWVRHGEMTVMRDAVTPWNVTSNAFKSMLSTHSTDQPGSWTDGVLFPAVFRRAGFEVAFITNQFYRSKRQNHSDFNGSFFLNDPRLDSLCFDYRNSRHFKYDGLLLKELEDYDARHRTASRPTLYILHFMGQHVLYKERCPESERTFTTADIDRPDLTEEERQIVADYDNATRYNDKVVGGIIDHFRREDAIIIYLADHGDEVYDGAIGMFGRNHTADLTPEVLRSEFEVPMLVWTSRRFARRRPEVAQAIRQAADLPFSTDDLPHLLLGLAGIDTPYYDARRDLFSPTFNPQRQRPIKGLKNYDDIIQD